MTGRPRARRAAACLGWLAACVWLGACRREAASPPPARTSNTAPPSTAADRPAPKSLKITHDARAKPVVGTEISVSAEGLPPGKPVDIRWGTVNGGWVVDDTSRFKGKKYTETTVSVGQATVDASGRLAYRFAVPEDYGGVHEIAAVDNGAVLAQGGVEVSQTFEMHPTEGPVGTPVEIRVHGLGWRTMESTWVVNWDNQQVGWVSAADTRGAAVARFRASGAAGPHAVKLYTGYMGQGYLNYQQAPNAYLPRPDFVFRITPGKSAAAPAFEEPYQKQPVPAASGADGAAAGLAPTQGPVATRALLSAHGLPPNTRVALVWGTQAGNRVSGTGFEPREHELGQQMVGRDGRLDVPITVPDDLGGLHALSIKSGDTVLARAYFVIETSIVSIAPTSGPAGTPVQIHLKGVGWTDYDNIYIATYDNAYMGYACGFNSQGDVVITFTAAGAPGPHLIDFYPGIYQGPDGGQQLYRLPQLTYADDHPGNKIPALRFAFDVTR